MPTPPIFQLIKSSVTIFLIASALFVSQSFAGGSAGGGGDAIRCTDGKLYKLDYLHPYPLKEADKLYGSYKSSDEVLLKLLVKLELTNSRLATHFKEYLGSLKKSTAYRRWIGPENKAELLDHLINDESILRSLKGCAGQTKNVALNQVVIRFANRKLEISHGHVVRGFIEYHYDQSDLDQLENNSPLQLAMLLTHEWLRDLTSNSRNIQNINRYLYTKDFLNGNSESLQAEFANNGVRIATGTHIRKFLLEDSYFNTAFFIQNNNFADEKALKKELFDFCVAKDFYSDNYFSFNELPDVNKKRVWFDKRSMFNSCFTYEGFSNILSIKSVDISLRDRTPVLGLQNSLQSITPLLYTDIENAYWDLFDGLRGGYNVSFLRTYPKILKEMNRRADTVFELLRMNYYLTRALSHYDSAALEYKRTQRQRHYNFDMITSSPYLLIDEVVKREEYFLGVYKAQLAAEQDSTFSFLNDKKIKELEGKIRTKNKQIQGLTSLKSNIPTIVELLKKTQSDIQDRLRTALQHTFIGTVKEYKTPESEEELVSLSNQIAKDLIRLLAVKNTPVTDSVDRPVGLYFYELLFNRYSLYMDNDLRASAFSALSDHKVAIEEVDTLPTCVFSYFPEKSTYPKHGTDLVTRELCANNPDRGFKLYMPTSLFN